MPHVTPSPLRQLGCKKISTYPSAKQQLLLRLSRLDPNMNGFAQQTHRRGIAVATIPQTYPNAHVTASVGTKIEVYVRGVGCPCAEKALLVSCTPERGRQERKRRAGNLDAKSRVRARRMQNVFVHHHQRVFKVYPAECLRVCALLSCIGRSIMQLRGASATPSLRALNTSLTKDLSFNQDRAGGLLSPVADTSTRVPRGYTRTSLG